MHKNDPAEDGRDICKKYGSADPYFSERSKHRNFRIPKSSVSRFCFPHAKSLFRGPDALNIMPSFEGTKTIMIILKGDKKL